MPRNYGQLDSRQVSEGDSFFLRMNTRLRPHQLEPGEVALSENGRMDRDGGWRVRDGVDFVSGSIAPINTTLPFNLPQEVESAARSSNTVTLTVTGHGLSSSIYTVEGINFTGDDPNGEFSMTATTVDTLTYVDSGSDETFTVDSESVVGDALLEVSQQVYGSSRFSDPGDANKEYIIIALSTKAVAIDLADPSTTTDISYPGSTTVIANCEVLQVFDKVVIFRDGYTPLEWDGDLSGSPAFVAADDGSFTQPVTLTDANCDSADGVVSFDNGSAHNLSDGDLVTIISSADAKLNDLAGSTGVYGNEFRVEVTGANTFTFNVPGLPDFTNQSTSVIAQQSVGGGYIHAPAPPWGIYHQRRLWVPYLYDPATDETTAATSRDIADEFLASQTLKTNVFDRIYDQFRVSGGSSDFLVALHPFTEDNIIAFNRNTIHLINGASGALDDIQLNFLTDEVGCLARKSIVTYSNQILFLSDNGVYSVSFVDEYNLRGTGVPLSEPVQTLIDDINVNLANKAVATYHNNRYWLAYPKGEDATGNNSLLVYNFLNQGWESIDTYADENFLIDNLIVAKSSQENSLYAITAVGGVHLIDGKIADGDLIASAIGESGPLQFEIPSALTTRQYDMDTADRKKFIRYEIQVTSSNENESNGTVRSIIENPDLEEDLDTFAGRLGSILAIGEDTSIRGRIGNRRGFGAQLKISPTTGKPKITLIKIDGVITGRAALSAS